MLNVKCKWLVLFTLSPFCLFAQNGIWISQAQLDTLPTNGAAWEQIKLIADSDIGTAKGGHNDNHDVNTLAQALVAARLGLTGAGASYRAKVADNLMSAIGSESGGNALSMGRNLPSYVIAADLINFAGFDASREATFRAWLIEVRAKDLGGNTIMNASEKRPNNWGLMCLAARTAAAIYLQEQAEITRVAQVFRGWLGDRGSYSGYKFGSLSWQADQSQPVGINPTGSVKEGHNIDGVLPDDQRRGGGFRWPPPKENYVYGALQAVLVTAELLGRQGYDTWNWSDRAVLRAFEWLNTAHFSGGTAFLPKGDDVWEPHVVNFHYGTEFWAPVPSGHGKNMGWTDWTHSGEGGGIEPPLDIPGVPTNVNAEAIN